MERQKLMQWVLILAGVATNITPKIAKPAADFIFTIAQNLINKIETEEDKAFYIPKILPSIKTIQPILQNDDLDLSSMFPETYNKTAWEEIISKIENIQDKTTENTCRNFILAVKKELFDDGEEYEKMPVLFIPFCREYTAKKVFAAIKKAKPKKLYIFSDGPRASAPLSERENVENLRKWVLENIDWDCEVFTKFEDKNLGARFGIEAAFDWFFENEEMGIILEDDNLPAPEFFRFCSELLIKYKDEEKIFYINGTNGDGKELSSNTYSFKKITDFTEDMVGIWGWATWRRAWKKHDKEMLDLKKYEEMCNVDEDKLSFDEYIKIKRMKSQLNQMHGILHGTNNTWDIQLRFSVLVNDGLIIIPNCNLVTNIGCCGAGESVHGTSEYSPAAAIATGEFFFPIAHPQEISARSLTVKEYLQAVMPPVYEEREFWEKEVISTERIIAIKRALDQSEIDEAQKNKVLKTAFFQSVYDLIMDSIKSGYCGKAQKHLHLALSKGGFSGEKNTCAKCLYRDCLSVCSTKSIAESKAEDGEFTPNIDRNICVYCWKCMRACRLVKGNE